MRDRRRLAPGEVAKELFGLVPDRDEKASQLCAEMLCMLISNGYQSPDNGRPLRGPKLRRFGIRSLVLGVNFLDQRTDGRAGHDDYTPQRYGELLAAGEDFLGSANLALARAALRGLVDPSTELRQPGTRLLLPFHESLVWFDARRTTGRPWTVRKVYMRGSGITLARFLLGPPDESMRALGATATSHIRAALQSTSPMAVVAERLDAALPPEEEPSPEQDEIDAWEYASDSRVAGLAAAIPHHVEGVMGQGQASGPARLWQLRTTLALDVIRHVVETAWRVTDTPLDQRFFLLTFGGGPRSENRVRHRSEESYQHARIRIKEATVRTIEDVVRRIAADEGAPDWGSEFEPRTRLTNIIHELRTQDSIEYESVARRIFEGGAYDRSGDGFRVLLESIGMLAGTGAYRYLTATPDLLAAMVGALSAEMPMQSHEFFRRAFEEWGVVVSAESAEHTLLLNDLDGAELARNQQRAEHLMVEAGLAISLSDRTTVVGERAARAR